MSSLSSGGYILVGVDGRGSPSTKLGSLDPRQFDEARLRDVVKKWIPEPLHLVSQVHTVDGKTVVLIHVGPARPHGFKVMDQDGFDPALNRPVFRKGDVLVRHGTASERWNPEDVSSVTEAWVATIREEERKRVGDVLRDLELGQRGQSIATGPIGALTLALAADDFDAAVMEAIHGGQSMALRHMLLPVRAEVESALSRAEWAEVRRILDRITSAFAIAVTYEDTSTTSSILDVFAEVYALGNEQNLPNPLPAYGDAPRLWFEIVTRLEAVGALAVRLRKWSFIRPLVLRTAGVGDTYVSWLRHGLTAAYNANIVVTDDGKPLAGPLVSAARQHIDQLPALRPDYPNAQFSFTPNSAPDPADSLLDSVTQFDLLWCVLAVVSGHDRDHYPSFSAFYARRSVPILDLIIGDLSVREQLLPEVPDAEVARAIQEVEEVANQEAWRTARRPWDITSPQVEHFVRTNYTRSS